MGDGLERNYTMLVSMKELLAVAEKENFTVGAFNTTELGNFKTLMKASRELDAPAIVMFNSSELAFCGYEYFEFVRAALANSDIPYALHLDHGKALHDIMFAIKCGFTSVMFDGSLLPFEENIERTKQVVDLAHEVGVSVEGELGTIGVVLDSDEGGVANITYTEPEEAKQFVDATGVDALAIAIGTSHGLYPKGYVPKLQIDRLCKIRELVHVPLVLHGGSGNPDSEIADACAHGVRKVNISSDYKSVYTKALTDEIAKDGNFRMNELLPVAIDAGADVIKHKMRLLGADGKAAAYRR